MALVRRYNDNINYQNYWQENQKGVKLFYNLLGILYMYKELLNKYDNQEMLEQSEIAEANCFACCADCDCCNSCDCCGDCYDSCPICRCCDCCDCCNDACQNDANVCGICCIGQYLDCVFDW